ncbi:MAG: hypothetical protein PHI90_04770 [Clostridia bacterium]|nr:hypothetical protein [Clostridia bacterium]
MKKSNIRLFKWAGVLLFVTYMLSIMLIPRYAYAVTFEEAQIKGRKIDGGAIHSISLKTNGTVACWGNDGVGQCNVPEELSNVVAVSAGKLHNMALKSDGTVICWGFEDLGRCDVPEGLSDVVAIAAGEKHSIALKSDGTVICWGFDNSGQCDVPEGLSDVVAIAAGDQHSIALTSDSTVVCWGYNGYGECDVPEELTLGNVVAVAAGRCYSTALKSDGTVVCWGFNDFGQCDVPEGLSNVVAIASSYYNSMALKSDGTVVCWGDNSNGECDVPKGLSNVVAIAAGDQHSIALTSDGEIVCWGNNSNGECDVPDEAFLYSTVATYIAKRMDGGRYHSVVLNAGGEVVCWGTNQSGQLNIPEGLSDVVAVDAGDYYTLALKSDGMVVCWGNTSYVPEDLSDVIDISAGYGNNMVLKSDGTVVCWGENNYGQCDVPEGLSDVVGISAGYCTSAALKSDGTVVCWGLNNKGQCDVPEELNNVVAIDAGNWHNMALKSDGTVVCWGNLTTPENLSDVVAIDAGDSHGIALKSDGTVVCWGSNFNGQLNVPVGLSNVVDVGAGAGHSMALKSDGTVVCWGWDYHGQSTPPAGLNVFYIFAREIGLDETFLTVYKGRSSYALIPTVSPVDATDKRVIWDSSDESILTVSRGVVTPVDVGTSIITARLVEDNTKYVECRVEVKDPIIFKWELNEGEGTQTADADGSGKTGVITGATWIDGLRGKALSFTGSTDYVKTKKGVAGMMNWSIETWVRPETYAGDSYVYSEKDAEPYMYVSITADNRIKIGSFHINRDGNWDIYQTEPNKVNRDDWNYIVVTLENAGVEADSGTVKCYVNGVLVGMGRLGACLPDLSVGARWIVGSDTTLTRIGDGVGETEGADFDNIYPWSEMILCNVADDGKINTYIGYPDFKRDGSNGQVMVKIPKFYYKRTYDGTKHEFLVSKEPISGFKLHPAFSCNGMEKPYILVGAYEAGLDDSFSTINSISGIAPDKSKALSWFRNLARARGEGWGIVNIQTHSAIQLLYLIEYANIDAQLMIGEGAASGIQTTGACDSLDGISGEVSSVVSYRGIENIWGSLSQLIDGVNIKWDEKQIYIADHDFVSNKYDEQYEATGIELIGSGNFAYNDSFDWLLVPSAGDGVIPDGNSNPWAIEDNLVPFIGGDSYDGTGRGMFFWSSLKYNNADGTIGTRINYIPQ